jgi:hypothetical protein
MFLKGTPSYDKPIRMRGKLHTSWGQWYIVLPIESFKDPDMAQAYGSHVVQMHGVPAYVGWHAAIGNPVVADIYPTYAKWFCNPAIEEASQHE